MSRAFGQAFGRGLSLAALMAASSLAAHAQSAAPEAAATPEAAANAEAAGPAILSLDQDALFARSKYGLALRARLSAETAKVEAESRRLDAELEAEERDLTVKRSAMTPEDFAPLAAAFDTKVQGLRAEREAAAAALRNDEAESRRKFFETAAQVIGDFMVERGAVAIIDKSVIIVSLNSLDVTDLVIARLDTVLGDAVLTDGAGAGAGAAPQ